jgi:tetratricopeptide (TPR) repeat protein
LQDVPRKDATSRRWFLEIFQQADGDPWRSEVRRAWRNKSELERLVKDVNVRRQPVNFLVLAIKALPVRSPGRLDLARRVQRANPDDFWANHRLGLDLHVSGKALEAIPELTAALALQPRNPGVYLNRSLAFRDNANLAQALADINQAIDLAPRYAAAWKTKGLLLQRMNELDKAEAALRQALFLDPRNAFTRWLLVGQLHKAGRHRDAETELRQAIAIDSKDARADANLGRWHSLLADTLCRLRDHGEAARAASALARIAGATRGDTLSAAGSLARCVLLAHQAPGLSEADRKARVSTYAAQGKRLLDAAATRSAGDTLLAQIIVGEEYCRVGLTVKKAGNDTGEELLKTGVDLLEDVAARIPADENLEGSGSRFTTVANMLRRSGQPAEARRLLERAIAQSKVRWKPELNKPAYQSTLHLWHGALAETLFQLGDHRELAKVAAELPKTQPDRWLASSGALLHLGRCVILAQQDSSLSESGRKSLVSSYGAQCKQWLDEAATCAPDEPAAQKTLGEWYCNLASQLKDAKLYREAMEVFKPGLALLGKQAEKFPTNEAYRSSFAFNSQRRNLLLWSISAPPEEMERAFRRAVALFEKMTADFPKDPAYRRELSYCVGNVALALKALKRNQEAQEFEQRVVMVREKLVKDYPDTPLYFDEYLNAVFFLVMDFHSSRKSAELRKLVDRALPLLDAHRKPRPDQPAYRYWYWILAARELVRQNHVEAAAVAAEMARSPHGDMWVVYDAACVLSLCVPLAERDDGLAEVRRKALAASYSDQALSLLRKAIEKGYHNVAHIKTDPDLAPLRPRAEFQKLLAEMERKKP